MTIGQALYAFFSDFDIPAYPLTSVPKDAQMPYITFSTAVSEFETETMLEANVWYKTSSESIPNAKAEEIARAIGRAGVFLKIDGGYIWLKKGSPFWQSIPDEDNSIKRRYFNIVAEYLR